MKVLVTGHKGFIGSNLVKYLKERNHEVEGFDVKEISQSNFEDFIPTTNNFDIVVHLGAISSTVERDINKILRYNLDFTKKLLDKCNKVGTSFIYASSASVYGNIQMEKNIPYIKETDPVFPTSPYSWSKFLFDDFINKSDNFEIAIQGIRLFNVYGNGEEAKGDQQSVFGKFKYQGINNKEIKVFEKSDQIKRDFIWVGDVCKVIEKMFDIDNKNIWNLGTGVTNSFMKIAKIYSDKFDAKITEIKMPDILKGQYQYFTCSNNDKLNNLIGKYKFKTIEEYIDDQ